MKLIIDIEDEALERLSTVDPNLLYTAIKNGTPYEERPQGDLISREALKNEMDRPFWEKWEWDFICKSIDNAPTVEKRPQGEWIKVGKYACECSRCGESVCGNLLNFCSNCGAEMNIKNISPDSGIREFDKKFADLIVFNDQPQRQLKSSDVHEDV